MKHAHVARALLLVTLAVVGGSARATATSLYCPLDDLWSRARFVGIVQVVSGTSEGYDGAVYKAQVVQSLKSDDLGSIIYFGPYIGTRVGWKYFVFLASGQHATLSGAATDSSAVPYPATAPYLVAMCEGMAQMSIDYHFLDRSTRGQDFVEISMNSIFLPEDLPTRIATGKREYSRVLLVPPADLAQYLSRYDGYKSVVPQRNDAHREEDTTPPEVLVVRGKVVRPDESPMPHARVKAVLHYDDIGLSHESETDSQGAFEIQLHGEPGRSKASPWNYIQVAAEAPDDYWLKTGDVFFLGSNGTAPRLRTKESLREPVVVRLGARGGKVAFQVWDTAVKRHITATLSVSKIEPKSEGVVMIATGEAGEEHVVFLPTGSYSVSLDHYPCHDKTYSADPKKPGVVTTFDVQAGVTVKQTLRVDTRKLDATPSYDNPRGVRCAP